MNASPSDQLFIGAKNGSNWWACVGLTQFASITGFGPFEEGQALWIAPGRDTTEIKIAIANGDRPTPLLVGTAAGLFNVYQRPSGEGTLVEIVMESASGSSPQVISNGPSSLGLWNLIVAEDGSIQAEHELV